MLLMTQDKITFGHKVQPICFPSLDPGVSALSNCKVSGWTGLKDAGSWCRLSVENLDPCPLQRTASTECCIHRGHNHPGCAGAGGSPVSCQVKARWLLAGVLSGGGMRAHVPVLYTRTWYYVHWISARAMEAGRPFIPTITISTAVLPKLHFRSAAKESQLLSRQEEDQPLMYDYYHDNQLPPADSHSPSPDVHLIVFVILLTK
ncbi:inactive serine protease 54 isoform X2 [Rhinoderma darwinii]|uniref:inactive serine protease 54 isoform X2 n=1 Tax=Rhinoderma darwinii TaxID=43563 RepID=UPI003F67AA91